MKIHDMIMYMCVAADKYHSMMAIVLFIVIHANKQKTFERWISKSTMNTNVCQWPCSALLQNIADDSGHDR